jgi:hypothetical protein
VKIYPASWRDKRSIHFSKSLSAALRLRGKPSVFKEFTP